MRKLNKTILVLMATVLCLSGCSNKVDKTEINNEINADSKFDTTSNVYKNLDKIVLDTLKHKYPLSELEIREKDKDLCTYVIYDKYNELEFNVETLVLSNQKVEFRDDYMKYNIDCKVELANSFKDNFETESDFTIETSSTEVNSYININYGDIYTDEEIYYLSKDIKKMIGLWLTYNLNPDYSEYVIESENIIATSLDSIELYYNINCNNYYGNNNGENKTIKFNYASSEFGLADNEELSVLIKEQLIFDSNKNILINTICNEEEVLNNTYEVTNMAEKILKDIYSKHGVEEIKEIKLIDKISETRTSYKIYFSTENFNIIVDKESLHLNEILVF